MRREIPIPEPVMHSLEMPDSLAGLNVDRYDRFRVEVVAQPISTVIVVRGSTGR